MASIIEHLGNWLSPDWNFDYACCREAILFTDVLYGVFLLLDTFIFLLYIYVFARNKTLHVNFRVILLVIAVNDMVLIYHRIADFWLTGKIDRENGFTYFIKMNCWATLIFSLCNIIGERCFALYAYQWYHDAYLRFPTTLIIIFIIEETVAGILISKKVISKMLILDCLAVVIIFTALFLIAIYRISQRRHRQMIVMRFQWGDGHCLSRRHRTMGILRENHLLQTFLPYLLISSLIQIVTGMVIMHFIVPIDHRYYLVSHCIFYLSISIRVLFDLLIPMLAHPVIKADATKTLRALLNIFRRNNNKIDAAPLTSTSPKITVIHSTNGQRLSFSPQEEKEMYFASYSQMW